jgi:hypothetical protein
MAQLLRRAIRPAVRLARDFILHWDILKMKLANRISDKLVTSSEGPVVSIATYGRRLETVYLTIESIARGSVRPARLLLWLDDPSEFANLPIQLKRLQARGLEVKLSDRNYGPHKKYFPYVMSRVLERLPGRDGPLVTADDDILYPRGWLRGLVSGHEGAPEIIQCYRARIVNVNDSGLQPYSTWELCRSTEPSFLTFAIGVSGVIYPPRFQDLLQQAGRAFERSCLRADDLWLHVNAVRNGFQIRQLTSKPVHFPIIPGTQEAGLQQNNLHNQGNDEQIKNTYGNSDIEILRSTYFAQNEQTV